MSDEPTSIRLRASDHGTRSVPPLGDRLPALLARFAEDGALGVLAVDATALASIETLYGGRALRSALQRLAERVALRVEAEAREDFVITGALMEEEFLLVFFHRPRRDHLFYTETLPRLCEELRGYLEHSLHRIIYPYLPPSTEIPVGYGLGLFRTHQRPESQLRSMIARARDGATFASDRIRRERADLLQRIVLAETLTTVYEPIVRLSDRKLLGYEALTRGPAGSGLERPPALFSIAASCDWEYELDNLCRTLALRNAEGLQPEDKLFLNILPTGIHDPDFTVSRVRNLLDAIGIAPSNLVLEVSEKQAIYNFPIFREAMDYFSTLGFGIALDDTGSGYSSLEAALELSPDYLKIDMSLVSHVDQNPQKCELLRGLQSLAEKMKASLIAEGIEREEELETLRDLGIAYGQGWAIGRGGPIRPSVVLGQLDETGTSPSLGAAAPALQTDRFADEEDYPLIVRDRRGEDDDVIELTTLDDDPEEPSEPESTPSADEVDDAPRPLSEIRASAEDAADDAPRRVQDAEQDTEPRTGDPEEIGEGDELDDAPLPRSQLAEGDEPQD